MEDKIIIFKAGINSLDMNCLYLSLFLLFIVSCTPAVELDDSNSISPDEQTILNIHQEYIDGWKNMDEKQVMSLFEEEARIQPNSLKPITGKANMRAFWFPNDSSVTTINAYETELLSLEVMDSLAVSTHTSYLDWSYAKDSLKMGMIQRGISTVVYRKQNDESWKVWRQMWTDIYAKRK